MRRVLAFTTTVASVCGAVFAAVASRTVPLSLVVLNSQAMRPGRLPDGWQVKINRGTPDISVIDGPSGATIRLKSRNSSFALERGVDVDLNEYPVLSWTWKVSELPQGGDFRHSRTDDQAAQVLVAFSDRRVLTYIWDSSAPRGTMQSASMIPLIRITAVVCRSGAAEANQWLTETRNLVQDYGSAYGKGPGRVKGIRLQINSQHTGTSAESYFGQVSFENPAR